MPRKPERIIEPIDGEFEEVAKAVVAESQKSQGTNGRMTPLSEDEQTSEATPFLLYKSEDGGAVIDVFIGNETVWLTQKRMADLFGVDRSVITKHLKNIFETNELSANAVCAIFAHTAGGGKVYNTKCYNLDVIISVGYRVNSFQATQFRIWAARTLREFIIKGFVLDDERLKSNNNLFGRDYFQDLIEKIKRN
uniref:Virulence protein RhuM family protein n=1 Tax=Candidatus Kentrum sp. SD TaxID=2126332 RepID=A0A450YAQ2_9GAMM|nr:MAG: Virulence protein RhuM family protein [Candidatus Kentron sp. SD]VFK44168.1 MAG: Virulence protein RhuM family protein [Candidatus Kentron sp. SD]VFK77892.1 MAG: Virulence protein RhuM family protein [Candidatus Kentron sp. SD]